MFRSMKHSVVCKNRAAPTYFSWFVQRGGGADGAAAALWRRRRSVVDVEQRQIHLQTPS
jgi:hypothetical protein